MNGRAIVFGAGGQVGRELLALASTRRLEMQGLAHHDANIADPVAVTGALRDLAPAVVINCAGYTAVDRAEKETELASAANADGPGVLAVACRQTGIPFIHLSTDYVFGGDKTGAYREQDKVAPINVYGRTKAEGERMIRAARGIHVILRTSWVFGIYGNNFLKSILRLAAERDELKIVGDQFGCPTSTADLAEAILAVAGSLLEKKEVSGTYHFAGTERTSWYDFAAEIVNQQLPLTGHSPAMIKLSTKEYLTAAKRPLNSELDSSLFRSTFGYAAKPWQIRVAEAVAALLAPNAPREAIS